MRFTRARENDMGVLIALRLAFLAEEGAVGGEALSALTESLFGFMERSFDKTLFAYIAWEGEEAIATVFLLINEKPGNLHYPDGRRASIINVFTRAEFRRRGAAEALMLMAIAEAKDMGIPFIELKATETGEPLYRKLGFREDDSFTHMRLEF